jgi:oxygen-independent coproporphyrinogen-3 oxidase
MSGIYIHVPYCKHKCEYCDFFSVVTSEGKEKFASLIEKELLIRSEYLPDNDIETIYFGGGTPSMLEANQISDILNSISKNYTISKNPEITLEANPDDLTSELLISLRSIGVNRLSIGIQSFSDIDLKQLGRRHDASQAVNALNMAHNADFDNISIDLIYGLPYSSTDIWISNLQKAFELPIKHLSSYHLIYEEGTPLSKRVVLGKVSPVSEDQSVEQFQILQEMSAQNGFIHYEISNLAMDGFFSRHNSSYWNQVPYLGLGPSAHSYNGSSRDWNPKSISIWKNSVENGLLDLECETLSLKDKHNDYLITSLRTIWGANIDFISMNFGKDKANQFIKKTEKYIQRGIIERNENIYRIKPKHFLTSDGVISDFLEI